MRKGVKRKGENEKTRKRDERLGGGCRRVGKSEGEKERERDECNPRFDGMGIRSSLFSAAICAGYFDSLRGHPK